MENLLDPSKYNRIHSIALNKSAWLIANETEFDDKGIISFLALSKIISGDDDDLIGRIIEAYSTISESNQGQKVYAYVRGQRYAVSLTEILWGRMCVIAYYFYHADPLWKDMGGHDKMLSMIKNTSIVKAVNDSIVLIDNYYSDVEAIKQKKAQKTSLTPQLKSNNHMPDVIQTMQDINNGHMPERMPALYSEDGEEEKRFAEYYSFTISGLSPETRYYYTRQSMKGTEVIDEETGSFETLSEAPEGIDEIGSEGGHATRKIMEDGQVLVKRGKTTYTLQGTKMK